MFVLVNGGITRTQTRKVLLKWIKTAINDKITAGWKIKGIIISRLLLLKKFLAEENNPVEVYFMVWI